MTSDWKTVVCVSPGGDRRRRIRLTKISLPQESRAEEFSRVPYYLPTETEFVVQTGFTDRKRSGYEIVCAIVDGVAWSGFDADERPSSRTD